jgi:hypothetical protein
VEIIIIVVNDGGGGPLNACTLLKFLKLHVLLVGEHGGVRRNRLLVVLPFLMMLDAPVTI